MRILQGDQYAIPFEIEDAQGSAILPDQVESIEIVVGHLTKRYPADISYANGQYLFPLTQEDTFAMKNNNPVQIRVKFLNGDVVGTAISDVNVFKSMSKEVL